MPLPPHDREISGLIHSGKLQEIKSTFHLLILFWYVMRHQLNKDTSASPNYMYPTVLSNAIVCPEIVFQNKTYLFTLNVTSRIIVLHKKLTGIKNVI